jgi:hypothetical protein
MYAAYSSQLEARSLAYVCTTEQGRQVMLEIMDTAGTEQFSEFRLTQSIKIRRNTH